MVEKQQQRPKWTKSGGKTGGRDWKPGQSGNPKGRPVDPGRKEALEMLKDAAPAVCEKALSMVLCDEPNVVVLRALIQKIFPDNLKLEGGENPLRIILEQYAANRPKI